ncbi:MAG: hypothetical protein M3171_14880 [Actinomycetota bacterium]|nr:hypothetical protein [Actinomycetota bacterium]
MQAVIDAGQWDTTTFILTWDDWGGYVDTVRTPAVETLPDALHPGGFQAIGGSRIPLLMFGGKVSQAIDAQWHSHATVPKTVIDLLGLPPMGVPRVDNAPSLAHLVDPALSRPAPPVPRSAFAQPTPPTPTPGPGCRPPGPDRSTSRCLRSSRTTGPTSRRPPTASCAPSRRRLRRHGPCTSELLQASTADVSAGR